MPLIPAIRPLMSIRRTAERPIRIPPMRAEMGVKVVSMMWLCLPNECRRRPASDHVDGDLEVAHAVVLRRRQLTGADVHLPRRQQENRQDRQSTRLTSSN